MQFLLLLAAFGFTEVLGEAKKYEPETAGGFEPSHHRYYEAPLPYRSNSTKQVDRKESKESRFGIITSSYGGTGPSGNGGGYGSVAPMKIDLGGVALGALIGFGAVLIIPKIAHILSGGIGGYRSLEGDMSSVTNVLARIDNSLEQQNIDSSACMQRVICSYVQDAENNKKSGEMGSIDEVILALTNNTLLSYVLDGTAVKQAVELGRSGDPDKCSSLLPKCAVTRENILKVISNILPS